MPDVIAKTERLLLRNWDEASKAEFVRVTNTPAVMRWLGGVAEPDIIAAAFGRIDSYQRDYGHTLWAVERRSDGALLGFCGLKRANSPGGEHLHGQFEVGWRLREDAWGQGFAKEAAIASLDVAFDFHRAGHVVALTVSGNSASQGLMRRLGMLRRQDLDYIDTRFANPGDFNPTIVYRIEADDWPAARKRSLG